MTARSKAPDIALQEGVFNALMANTDLTQKVSSRVWDTIPDKPAYPFLYIGDDMITAEFEMGYGNRCDVRVHVFSRSLNKKEIKELAMAVRETLDNEIQINGFTTGEFTFEQTIYQTEEDGSHHAIVALSYLLFETQP